MIKKSLSTVVLIWSFMAVGHAQGAFEQFAAGIEAGTYGPGITLATSLSPHFRARAGFDILKYAYKESIDMEANGYELSSPETIYPLSGKVAEPTLSFLNGKAIVDYYPSANGIFSISAGLYVGTNTVDVSGKIDDYTNPNIVFNARNIVIQPDADGSYDGKLKLGGVVKPYFGLGLGRTIANRRVGFKFDMGLIYQGDYRMESKNVISGSKSVLIDNEAASVGIPTWLFKVWPMLNFSLSYRIF